MTLDNRYPCARYNADYPNGRVINSAEEEAALEGVWYDHPSLLAQFQVLPCATKVDNKLQQKADAAQDKADDAQSKADVAQNKATAATKK